MQEADLSKPFERRDEELNNATTKVQLADTHSDDSTEDARVISQIKPENICAKNDTEIPPVPKTAVQFLMNWKQCTTSYVRYKYLKVGKHNPYSVHFVKCIYSRRKK